MRPTLSGPWPLLLAILFDEVSRGENWKVAMRHGGIYEECTFKALDVLLGYDFVLFKMKFNQTVRVCKKDDTSERSLKLTGILREPNRSILPPNNIPADKRNFRKG